MIQISVVNKAFEGGQSRLSGANAGIVLTTTDGRGNASVVEQNVLGWTTKTTDAAGNATTTAYDLAHGKPSCVTDALGKTHRRAYDLHGNVVAEFGTGVQPAAFAYDAADRKISQKLFRAESASAETDPRSRTDGDETQWEYHEATGLLLSKTYPDESRVDYAYDAHNRLSATTLAREVSPGVRLKLTRAYADLTGELVSLTSNDGTVSETCAYDRLGHLVSASDASGTTSYQYDEYGELSEETKSGGLFVPTKTLTYHRDEFGRDAGYSIDGARKTTLSYDPATGRIASVSVSGAGVFSWEYLAGTSLKSKLSYPNSATAEWTYEEKRDLLASVKNTVNGRVISRYAYENDAAGRRVSSVKSGAMMGAEAETLSYGYDARGELVSAISDVNPDYAYGYGFDEAGNRDAASEAGRLLTYTTNALNQYASVSEGEVPFVPEYDLDGNATRLRTSTGTWSVEYNAHNRPVSWRKTTGEVVYMIYDAQGRRAEKRVLNASGKRTLRERYVYVGYTCVQVLNGDKNNALVKEFAWDPTEPEATRPLTFRHAEKGLMLFYAFDGNKNVSDVFFFALQNGIGAHYEYAPFGAVTRTAKATGSKVDLIGTNPWRFSSEFYDSELDLVYYNYRHYSPTDGRFLSRDPIEEQGGLNLYAHCENNPIGKSDILGRAIPQLGAGPDVEAPQPPKPDCTERIRAFEKWIEEEAKDLTWLDKIPACPKKLSCKEEEKSISIVYPNGSVCVTKVKGLFCNSPDPSRWALTSDLLFHCFSESGHPGGKYELRTIPKDEYGGAGNQCIYDESGNLVEMHPTAGTADKYSPGSGILDGIIRAPKHNLVDVRPFKEAQYLDRNCGGNGIYEQKYYTVRPAK